MNGTLNKVILIGNVGKDVEVHYFDDKSLVARFPLATSEVYKDRNGERRERTEWHNIVARNQVAEIFKNYVRKGDKLYIEGKIRTREYTDKEGNKRYFTEIHVQQFTFLSPKPSAQSGQEVQATSGNPVSDTPGVPSEESDDDDLPF
jgi:single-strand DNA-binding protein